MKYNVALFDLDGTLTDPGIGITNSVAYALRRFNIDVPPREQLYKFIGPPLAESFERFYGFSPDHAMDAVNVYREYFRDKGMLENRVYDGIFNMLDALRSCGIRLAIATSKPELFAKQIADYFELSEFFELIAGPDMDESRSGKAAVIEYALRALSISDKSTVVMIGDREHDIIGAKANGISSIGVTYGYGSRDELTEAGADYIADSPENIIDILR